MSFILSGMPILIDSGFLTSTPKICALTPTLVELNDARAERVVRGCTRPRSASAPR
jgi:hypothetical protein